MFKRVKLIVLLVTLYAVGFSHATPLDPVYLKRYGGTYSVNCSDAKADQLKVLANQLVVTGENHELVTKDIEANVFYWGRMPPDNFEISLNGVVKPPLGLDFIIYSDKRGFYIELDGAPDVLKAISFLSDSKTRFYKCQ